MHNTEPKRWKRGEVMSYMSNIFYTLVSHFVIWTYNIFILLTGYYNAYLSSWNKKKVKQCSPLPTDPDRYWTRAEEGTAEAWVLLLVPERRATGYRENERRRQLQTKFEARCCTTITWVKYLFICSITVRDLSLEIDKLSICQTAIEWVVTFVKFLALF